MWKPDPSQIITREQKKAATITEYESAIQNLVDETARNRQFRDAVTLASYTASTIPDWANQAKYFVAWRDEIWRYSYEELEKVQNGYRQQPSVNDFILELPLMNWP